MMRIFSKRLTRTDVESRLAIPTKCLVYFRGLSEEHHPINFTAVDLKGHPWPFRLSTRRKGTHPKPVLDRRGWLAFVEAKRLKKGDRITFSMEADEANGVIFRIQADKTIRLFGKNITKVV